jgi:hypothetical protein
MRFYVQYLACKRDEIIGNKRKRYKKIGKLWQGQSRDGLDFGYLSQNLCKMSRRKKTTLKIVQQYQIKKLNNA